MKPLAVARRYARALADVAWQQDPKILDRTSREVSLAAEVLAGDPQFLRFFDDPSIRREDKDASIETLVRKAELSEDYSLRSLKQTYVTYLEEKGVPIDVIQRLVSHTSPNITWGT